MERPIPHRRTPDWTPFVGDRARTWRAERQRHIAVHGLGIFDGLDGFYGTVRTLFGGGSLGGIRVQARKG